jgi:hypothetical protein
MQVLYVFGWTVPWLRQLVSPWRPGFAGFAVDSVALGQVYLRVIRFSPVSVIQPSLSTLISSGYEQYVR